MNILPILVKYPSIVHLLATKPNEYPTSFLNFALLNKDEYRRYVRPDMLWKAIYYLYQGSKLRLADNLLYPSMIIITDHNNFNSVILKFNRDEIYYIRYNTVFLLDRMTESIVQSCLLAQSKKIDIMMCEINDECSIDRLLELLDERVDQIVGHSYNHPNEAIAACLETIPMTDDNDHITELIDNSETTLLLKALQSTMISRLDRLKKKIISF